jgi:hypothetical protein
MSASPHPNLVRFGRDTTLRWPMRGGDFLLWFDFPSPFLQPEKIRCRDFWEMRDGQHILITNRWEDLPPWFELHPTEAVDSFVWKLCPDGGTIPDPGPPMQGPNLWRLQEGDRLVWLGDSRPDRESYDGILAVLDPTTCVLVVGLGEFDSLEEYAAFGAPTTKERQARDAERFRAARDLVSKLGSPRTRSFGWALGD